MHKKRQYDLLTTLREHVAHPAIQKDLDRAWKNYPHGFAARPTTRQRAPGRPRRGSLPGQARRLPTHLTATYPALRRAKGLLLVPGPQDRGGLAPNPSRSHQSNTFCPRALSRVSQMTLARLSCPAFKPSVYSPPRGESKPKLLCSGRTQALTAETPRDIVLFPGPFLRHIHVAAPRVTHTGQSLTWSSHRSAGGSPTGE